MFVAYSLIFFYRSLIFFAVAPTFAWCEWAFNVRPHSHRARKWPLALSPLTATLGNQYIDFNCTIHTKSDVYSLLPSILQLKSEYSDQLVLLLSYVIFILI